MERGATSLISIAERISVSRFRAASFATEVLVRPGEMVDAADPVARAEKPGAVHAVDVAAQLGIPRSRIADTLCVGAGDKVSEGQSIASNRGFLGLWPARAISPCTGIVDTVSSITGHVVIRGEPTEIAIRAFASGRVASIRPGVGVEIEAEVALLKGALGLGGEAMGPLCVVCGGSTVLDPDALNDSHRGAVVATSGTIPLEAMRRASILGVAALVGGSARGEDLAALLQRLPNLAAAGDEAIGFTLLLIEGVGALCASSRAVALLEKLEGRRVAVSGVTQVRAGVIRPELMASPIEGAPLAHSGSERSLRPGSTVRIVRGARFGEVGEIVDAPSGPRALATGARALVYVLGLADGKSVEIPRQNVEPWD